MTPAITAPQDLVSAAQEARKHSYSPYSKFAVGAAFRTDGGKIYSGCNVENASYGATCCAERTAVFKAVSELGKLQIQEIVVATSATPPAPPCGICLQVLAEFSTSETRIFCINPAVPRDQWKSFLFSGILPCAFTLSP